MIGLVLHNVSSPPTYNKPCCCFTLTDSPRARLSKNKPIHEIMKMFKTVACVQTARTQDRLHGCTQSQSLHYCRQQSYLSPSLSLALSLSPLAQFGMVTSESQVQVHHYHTQTRFQHSTINLDDASTKTQWSRFNLVCSGLLEDARRVGTRQRTARGQTPYVWRQRNHEHKIRRARYITLWLHSEWSESR